MKRYVALPRAAAPSISPAMVRFGLSISAVVFVLDQISKWLVLGVLKLSPPGCLEAGVNCRFIEISPIFDLRMVWNRGISFGLFRADNDLARWGLVLGMLIIAGVFASWLRTAERRLTGVALGLVVGGALGNVVDRIVHGAVVDFLDFSGLYFPFVFNVADSAITVGAMLLAADLLLFTESKPGEGTGWDWLKARFGRGSGG